MKHEVAELARDRRLGIDADVGERLERYVANLEKWQPAINLVAPKSLPEVWTRHVLDSLQLVPLIPESARVIVDLGSGAGFPGLVLACLGRWDVHLVESDTRKAVFLRETARLCGVPVTVHAARAETLSAPKADVVTARALASVVELLRLSAGVRHSGTTHLFLKGRGAAQELTEAEKTWTLSAERTTSLTDPEGVVLHLREVHPK